MGNSVSEYLKLVRADEYAQEEARVNAINEATEESRRVFNESMAAKELPVKVMKYQLDVTKAVIVEAVSRLYMDSLVIENANELAPQLMPVARREVVSALSECDSFEKLHARLEHASPYIKALLPLAEAIAEEKPTEEAKAYDKKVILSKDDMKLIDQFERENSKDVYAGALQDRIIDIYKDEEAKSKEQKEKIDAVVDSLSAVEGETMAEAVAGGVNVFNNGPKSLFNAIYINKSRAVMTESGNANVSSDDMEDILCETLCTYTLLECIHSLGIKTYTKEETTRLMYEFAVN